MKVFKFFIDGYTLWVACESVYQGMMYLLKHLEYDASDFDGKEPEEIPESGWSTLNVTYDEEEDGENITIPLSDLMKGIIEPEVVASNEYL